MGPSLARQLFGEVGGRLILSVSTCALWLMFTLVMLRLFRVKNPSVRYLFIFIPLVKSLLVLIRQLPQTEPFPGFLILGPQFMNPGDFIPAMPELTFHEFAATSAWSTTNAYLVVGLILGFFAWRLTGLFQFLRILHRAAELVRSEHEDVYAILDRLTVAADLPNLRLIQVELREAPFTAGLRRPVIALSRVVLDELSLDELEAVLAHEIAHIARRDYLHHWVAVLLRDLLFFNPLAHAIYARLSFERERACDDYGGSLSQRLKLAKSLVKLAELKKLAPSVRASRSFAPQSLMGNAESSLCQRVKELLHPAPYRPLPMPRKIALIFLAAFVFYLEIHIVIMVKGAPLILA